jgi:ABC-type multidrug transport system ATPase subunit
MVIEFLKNHLRKVKPHSFPIRAPHLVDLELMKDLSTSLDMPDSAKEFDSISNRRLLTRSLQVTADLLSFGSLVFMGKGNPSMYLLLQGMSSICMMGSGYISTANADDLHAELLALRTELGKIKLGDVGSMIDMDLGKAAETTELERMLYSTPPQVILRYLVKSGIALSASPEQLISSVAIIGINLGLILAQDLWIRKKFAKKINKYEDAENRFITNPKDGDLRKRKKSAQREKSLGTVPINGARELTLSLGIFFAAFGHTELSGILAVLASQFSTGFSSIADMRSKMNVARKKIDNLNNTTKEALEIIKNFISNQEDLNRHIKKTTDEKLLITDKIIDEVRRLGIKNSLVLNILLDLEHSKKRIKAIFNTDKPICFVGDEGSGKTSAIEAIVHGTDRHEGDIVEISDNGGVVVNIHDIKQSKLIEKFHRWGPDQYETTKGSLEKLTGMNAEQIRSMMRKAETEKHLLTDIVEKIITQASFYWTDLGTEMKVGGLSEGQRRFAMILVTLINAKKNNYDFLIIDEPFATMKNSDNGLQALLVYFINDFQKSGGKVILTMQNATTIPAELSDQIVDFNKQTIRYDASNSLNNPFFIDKLFLLPGEYETIPTDNIDVEKMTKDPEYTKAVIRSIFFNSKFEEPLEKLREISREKLIYSIAVDKKQVYILNFLKNVLESYEYIRNIFEYSREEFISKLKINLVSDIVNHLFGSIMRRDNIKDAGLRELIDAYR